MHGIASGSIRPKKGQPSKAVAQEFVATPPRGKLPARVAPKKQGKG